MKLDRPRIAPIAAADWTAEQREIMAPTLRTEGVGAQAANVLATLIHHPKLMKRWLVFANHCLFKSSLPARDRELVILRTAWLAQSEYEWGQHVVIGRRAGIDGAAIEALKQDLANYDWATQERAALAATDELSASVFITDDTWRLLAAHYSREQIIDLILLVGQYRGLVGALNSLGVQLDPGLKGF